MLVHQRVLYDLVINRFRTGSSCATFGRFDRLQLYASDEDVPEVMGIFHRDFLMINQEFSDETMKNQDAVFHLCPPFFEHSSQSLLNLSLLALWTQVSPLGSCVGCLSKDQVFFCC